MYLHSTTANIRPNHHILIAWPTPDWSTDSRQQCCCCFCRASVECHPTDPIISHSCWWSGRLLGSRKALILSPSSAKKPSLCDPITSLSTRVWMSVWQRCRRSTAASGKSGSKFFSRIPAVIIRWLAGVQELLIMSGKITVHHSYLHEKSMDGEKTNERIMSEETVRVQKLAQVSLFRSFCGNMRMKTEKPASTWNQTHEQCR